MQWPTQKRNHVAVTFAQRCVNELRAAVIWCQHKRVAIDVAYHDEGKMFAKEFAHLGDRVTHRSQQCVNLICHATDFTQRVGHYFANVAICLLTQVLGHIAQFQFDTGGTFLQQNLVLNYYGKDTHHDGTHIIFGIHRWSL